jgi:hypothetical protein
VQTKGEGVCKQVDHRCPSEEEASSAPVKCHRTEVSTDHSVSLQKLEIQIFDTFPILKSCAG